MTSVIKTFSGENRFLSNFAKFEKPMEHRGVLYASVEHFYAAMKSTSHDVRVFISSQPKAGLAKKEGSKLTLRPKWEENKDRVMLAALRYKFSKHNPHFRQALLDTDTAELQEGNYWKDTYWGIYIPTGKGLNRLGCLLMQVREEIANDCPIVQGYTHTTYR